MAGNGSFGVYFEHLYTRVNGVGDHEAHQHPLLVVCSPPSSLTSAPAKSGLLTPDMSRHPQFTDSFLPQINYTG